MNLLFHVYNISGYLMAEISELLARDVEIGIIETPCSLSGKAHEMFPQIHWFDSIAKCDFKPDVFFCGGWADKEALGFAKELHKNSCVTVLLIDTPWQGLFKQYIHCMISRFYLTHIFDYAWGAGEPQAKYLRRLGFSKDRIKTGYYSADTKKFAALYDESRVTLPHKFLYVGRYVAVKNMRLMERAFIKAIEKMPQSDWELVCIGCGELWDERTIHPRISHNGYISPIEIQDHLKGAGVFVLPSLYEPWGVVVHEFAAMGLPLLCSEKVQAATAYLQKGKNGYQFDPMDEESLVDAFCKIMELPDSRLVEMGKCSHELGMSYTTSDWASKALSFWR